MKSPKPGTCVGPPDTFTAPGGCGIGRRLPALAAALLLVVQPGPAGAQTAAGGNRLRASAHDVHRLILDETAEVFSRGTLESRDERLAVHSSRVIETEFPFNDLVPSWNVEVPDGSGFSVEFRLGRQEGDFWTPFYYLGAWGDVPDIRHKHLRDDNGFINVDYFQSSNRFDRIQYRVSLSAAGDGSRPVLRRFGLAYSNTLGDEQVARVARRFGVSTDPGPKEGWARRLPVPFRSQKDEDERIRNRVCSPTSVAMVMQYHGVDQPTAAVCRVIWDPEYRIYGNWARAVQGAHTWGLPGYIERFGDWDALKSHIARGVPVIVSIRAARGQLRGAPYRQSAGHLLVVTGFDEDGNVHVNDPAAPTREGGMITYARQDMEQVWLANGGIGYILLPPHAAE